MIRKRSKTVAEMLRTLVQRGLLTAQEHGELLAQLSSSARKDAWATLEELFSVEGDSDTGYTYIAS